MVRVEWRQMCAAGEVMLVRLFAVVKNVERKGKVEVNAAFDAGRCEGGALRGGAFFVAHARVAVAERPPATVWYGLGWCHGPSFQPIATFVLDIAKKYDTKVCYCQVARPYDTRRRMYVVCISHNSWIHTPCIRHFAVKNSKS